MIVSRQRHLVACETGASSVNLNFDVIDWIAITVYCWKSYDVKSVFLLIEINNGMAIWLARFLKWAFTGCVFDRGVSIPFIWTNILIVYPSPVPRPVGQHAE